MKNNLTLPIMLPDMRTMSTRQKGFSLLEVLVALLVISFGLLGIAGMQALSISNTNSAGFRGIAAMQASSLAAAMGANEMYWQQPTATAGTQVSGTTSSITITNLTGGDANLNGSGLNPAIASNPCLGTVCSATSMAQADLTTWGGALAQSLPGGYGTVACQSETVPSSQSSGVSTPVSPTVSCTIMIYWTEKNIVQNQSSSVSSTASQTDDYQVVVQP